MHRAGPTARTLNERVAQLEGELRRVERERDILKKALAILSQHAYLAYAKKIRGHPYWICRTSRFPKCK